MEREVRTGSIRAVSLLFALGLIVAAALLTQPVVAAGKGELGPVFAARVELDQRQADLSQFERMELDVDGVFDGWARIYLIQEEIEKLQRLGYRVSVLWQEPVPVSFAPAPPEQPAPPGQLTIPAQYHTYDTLTTELQAIATANPDLTRLSSIGQSVQGRELWMLKISRNPDLEEDEPEFAYVAAMHGDEVVGKELCIGLVHYLLDNYASDSRVTDLIDNAEIWIMPSMNPDGTELHQRYNANGFDLNRDFPDWWHDAFNTPDGRQPETQSMMAWVAERSIDYSANFHGGALLVNYPFDGNPSNSSVFSPTPDPDDPLLLSVSLTYAENNTPMYTSPSFPQGVTNGAEWYAIKGGMQDWSYVWHGKFDVTVEVSNTKWPSANQLPGFWDDNLESMLAYLERVHEGLRGLVTDAVTGAPVAARIYLDDDPFAVYTDPDVGDYHRLVLPGNYTMQVAAEGYHSQMIPVEIPSGPAVRYDVALDPLSSDLQPVATRVADGLSGNLRLDPGETADLVLTLKNMGNMATGISGRLIPTGWDAEIMRGEASYPAIANQATAESIAPHYSLHVDSSVPEGRKVGFAVDWSADQGGGTSEPFFLEVGASACETSEATDVPRSIVDFSTASSVISFGTASVVDEVRVGVDISHTFTGDLTLTLESPSGTRVKLHDRTGSSSDDIVGTYGVDLNPAEPLSVLQGEPTDGAWILEVRDDGNGDNGTLNSWDVEICGWSGLPATPEMRFRDLAMEPGGVRLNWWPYPGLESYRVYISTDPSSSAAFVDATSSDADTADTTFKDLTSFPGMYYYLVTGVGEEGEGPLGHFGE